MDTVEIQISLTFEDLKENCWSGAIYTLEKIEKEEKEKELMEYLNMIFEDCEELPTLTDLNDILWFEDDEIEEYLSI